MNKPRYEYLEKENMGRLVFRDVPEEDVIITFIGPCIVMGQTRDGLLAYIEAADLAEPFNYQEWLGACNKCGQ